MISVNLLRTKVLITTDEVIFHAPMEGTVDPRVLIQNIIIAERRFIKPMLGNQVYEDLIEAKNILVTALNKVTYQTMLDDTRPVDREVVTVREGDLVNSDTFLNATQLALWKNHLHKIVAEAVYFVSLPVNRARFTSAGMMKNNPENITEVRESTTIELEELKHLLDNSLLVRINPLVEDMHNYLCSTSYTGYTKDCGCTSNGVSKRRKSDIYLKMYDKDNDSNCDCDNSLSWQQT